MKKLKFLKIKLVLKLNLLCALNLFYLNNINAQCQQGDIDNDGICNIIDECPIDAYHMYDIQNNNCAIAPVVINEILTQNFGSITNLYDEDGDSPDYIELYNTTNSSIDLGNWKLINSNGIWKFPQGASIEANSFLSIWASGKDKTTNELHTNFELSSEGEYLGLYDNQNNLIFDFGEKYPQQYLKLSYGINNIENSFNYFHDITKNQLNGNGVLGKVAVPSATIGRGFYENAFNEALLCETDNAIIRYTLDGSPVTSNSAVFNGPITISPSNNGGIIRAKAYLNNYEPSDEISFSYIFPNDIYSGLAAEGIRDLPVIRVQTDNQGQVYETNGKVPSMIELIKKDSLGNNVDCFSEYGAISVFGETTVGTPKRNYRIHFDVEYNKQFLEYPLFEDYIYGNYKPRVKFRKFELKGGSYESFYSNKAYITDNWFHSTVLESDAFGVHSYFVNLFVNEEFKGIYNLRERFDHDTYEAYKKVKSKELNFFRFDGHSPGTNKIFNGSNDEWNILRNEPNYQNIKNKIDINSILSLVALESLLFTYWEQEYRIVGNTISNAPYHFIASDISDFGFVIGGSYWAPGDHNVPTLLPQLDSWLSDPEFQQEVFAFTAKHFCNSGAFTVEASQARLDKWINEIDTAIYSEANLLSGSVDSWNDQMALVASEINTISNMHQAWTAEGLFDGCDVRPLVNTTNQISAINTAVSYLIDAQDPDGDNMTFTVESGLPNGLNINSSTGEISGTPTQLGTYQVKVKVEDTNNKWGYHYFTWEIINTPAILEGIIINEIMYNSDSLCVEIPIDKDLVNYIELKNISNESIDLSRSKFTDGVNFEFPMGTILASNDFYVIAEDSLGFELAYGYLPNAEYRGGLDAKGERLELSDSFGNIIDSLRYNDKNPWDEAPDGGGTSLELLNPLSDNANPFSWFRSDNNCGTPGAENSRVCEQAATNIIINEINYNSNNDVLDPGNWVELHNPNANAVDLSGWTFYDNGGSFVIPQGTTLPAEGYIILVESQADFSSAFPNINQSKIVGEFSFGLSKKGERVSLFDQNKCLVDYVIYNDKAPWPEAPDGDGPTLSLLEPSLDNALPESWESSFEMNESFVHGSPGVSNICVPGQPCDDGDACTTDDTFDADCNCVGILMPEDADNDGVCDLADFCPNVDDNLIGTPCDDGDICTEGETYDENCGCSGGVVNDIDNDGLCDPLDACDNNLTGTPCDDGDICTLGETYDINCNCTGGFFQDADNDGICDAEDICPNLENNLLGQLCDDGNPLTEFDTYNTNTCSCSGIIASASICVQVSSSEDDAEQQVDNGVVTLTSGDLDMVNDEGVVFIAAIRFQNIDIPQGATITNATIQFAADEVKIDPTNLTIKAEAIDHAPVFEATVNNISNRSLTASSVIWNPDPWNTIGENIEPQKTIDLSPIIQEIIDRPGFVQGNAIALVIEGSGIRTAESFDGSETLAPELCITYSTGQCVENYPCDDGNPVTINDQYNSECECVGEDITLNAKILLEGFYDAQNNNMHTLLYEKNLIPLSQPYDVAPWNYQGEESVSSIPEGVVDWILLITRDQDGNILDQAAGFITQSGEIMSIDGTLGIPINDGIGNQFSIHHRSHLAVLSSSNYDGGMYDFTLSENQAEGNGQLKLVDGKYMLYAGDYDGKGIINNIDFNDWKIQGAIINQYLSIDGDGNGIINSLDYNLWTNNKSKVGHPSIRFQN